MERKHGSAPKRRTPRKSAARPQGPATDSAPAPTSTTVQTSAFAPGAPALAPPGIAFLDEKGRVLRTNEAFDRMLAADPGDPCLGLEGHALRCRVPAATLALQDEIERALRQEAGFPISRGVDLPRGSG